MDDFRKLELQNRLHLAASELEVLRIIGTILLEVAVEHAPKKRAKASVKPAFDFDTLYERYPRKEGKQIGLTLAASKITTQGDYEALGRAIDKYSAHCRKTGTEPQYVKHFSTFMGSWRDWDTPDAGKVSFQPQPAFAPDPQPVKKGPDLRCSKCQWQGSKTAWANHECTTFPKNTPHTTPHTTPPEGLEWLGDDPADISRIVEESLRK